VEDTQLKRILASSVLSLSLIITGCVNVSQSGASNLTGPYLGQNTPGTIPEIFAPGIVSGEGRDLSGFFNPDLTEFYFTRRDSESGKWSLIAFTRDGDQWEQTSVTPRIGRPVLSPDGQTMHLGKRYMDRTQTGWSDVKSLGPMFEREEWGIMRLSSSSNGTYVFDDYKGSDVIRISTLIDGVRQEPEQLGPEINTGELNAHPFIAPDESYLIWDGVRAEGYGRSDLWISFKQQDGTWGQALNMGPEINTEGREASAFVTADGEYILFSRTAGSDEGDIYWADAQIIETLRNK
jgi:hypothetical protein